MAYIILPLQNLLSRITRFLNLLYHFLTRQDRLSSKASAGVVWMGSRQVILQILLFIKILFVANLLGPEIYGIFGITLLIILLSEQFTHFGIDFALIHKQNKSDFYDSAWTFKFLRSLVLFGLILGFKKQILAAFGITSYSLVLLVMASIFLFEGLVNIGTLEFRRELEYHKEFTFKAVPDIANLVVTIVLTIIYRSIWGLVLGVMVERVLRLFLSYYLHPYRPSFSLHLDDLRDLLGYGKWVLLLGLLKLFTSLGLDFFVGLVLGATFVAFFQISYKIIMTPLDSLTELLTSVSIPTYAKLQQDQSSAQKTFYLTLLGQFTLFSLFVSIFYPVVEAFVVIVLGQQWTPVIPLVRLFIVVGYLILVVKSIEPIFFANGIHEQLVLPQIMATLTFVLLVLPVLERYGLQGLIVLLGTTLFLIIIGYLFQLSTFLAVDYLKLIKSLFQIAIIHGVNYIVLQLLVSFTVLSTLFHLLIYGLLSLLFSSLLMLLFHLVSNVTFFNDLQYLIESSTGQSRDLEL